MNQHGEHTPGPEQPAQHCWLQSGPVMLESGASIEDVANALRELGVHSFLPVMWPEFCKGDGREAWLSELIALLREYRFKTPLAHQPHMIAKRADDVLAAIAAQQENNDDR